MKKMLLLIIVAIACISCSKEDEIKNPDPFIDGMNLNLSSSGFVEEALAYKLDLYKSKEDWQSKKNVLFSKTIKFGENVKIPAGVIDGEKRYFIELESQDGRFTNWSPDNVELPAYFEDPQNRTTINELPGLYVEVVMFEKIYTMMPGVYEFVSATPIFDENVEKAWEGIEPMTIEFKRDFTVVITDMVNGKQEIEQTSMLKYEELPETFKDEKYSIPSSHIFKDKDIFNPVGGGLGYFGSFLQGNFYVDRGLRQIDYKLKQD
ncbi:hypothetical protein ABW636_19815 [Aquimarina sp. 2201CG1-2-11]|uniref:hypothetical protein n=1 Tax=Aquimarina discodermiae TaxID=3231043 RepID=UPI003461F851